MCNIKLEIFKNGQETIVFELIKRVFDEFVAPDYSEEGNRFFNDWINPKSIAERQQNGRNIHLAFCESILVGMIEIRDKNHISLLFVDKNYHRLGIAKKLLLKSITNCIKIYPEIDLFLVNASPYSIPIYKKLGFTKTASLLENHGIKYMPMELKIVI